MERQEYLREYQRTWMARRRAMAVKVLGGKCAWCGSTENLEFDHIHPKDKDPDLRGKQGSMWSWPWQRIETELEKCWLLCHECHRVKTRDDRPEVIHGTAGMWHRFKCRCQECRAWMAASQRAYRARKRELGQQ